MISLLNEFKIFYFNAATGLLAFGAQKDTENIGISEYAIFLYSFVEKKFLFWEKDPNIDLRHTTLFFPNS